MRVLLITTGSYPYGGAVTNRHLSYLKGMAELGTDIKLIVLQPDNKQSELSIHSEGEFNGIKYKYATWYLQPPRSIVSKVSNKIKSHLEACRIIKNDIQHINRDEIKLIVSVPSVIDILPYLFIRWKYKIPVFHERAEYPFLGVNGMVQKLLLSFYLHYIIPGFDGIFVISKTLVSYFGKYVNESDKILHLPMTVEHERFDTGKKESNKYGKYIAYCGSMYTDKDGVPDLIEAFNLFCQHNSDTNLLLIGDNRDKIKFKQIENCINSSPFSKRIYCTGWVDRDQMPGYLDNAAVLALARPDNIQAKGGFPTKLGEYLSTRNPVVITDVGEHTEYLSDGVSAYISKPGNTAEFAEKLRLAVSNPDQARKIGEEGKKVALEQFNYKLQARKLYRFLNTIHYA